MTDPVAPSTTPSAMARRALPRLVFVLVLVGLAVTSSGWVQVFAVILLLLAALGAADWARYVRTGVQPGAAPAKIPDRFRGGELEVWLDDAGTAKIQTIKLVRELTGLGLKQAKDLVENPPARLASGLNEQGAAWVSKPFTAAGARTSLRPAGSDEGASADAG